MIAEVGFIWNDYVSIEFPEKHIINCIRKHPSIFPHKFAVLHHIFCVNGNGYDWNGEDGKIYHLPINDKPVDKLTFEEYKFRYSWTSFTREKDFQKEKRIAQRAVHRARTKSLTGLHEIYPLCEYALICSFPPNFDRKWFRYMKEMLGVILFLGSDRDLKALYEFNVFENLGRKMK